MCVKYVYYDMCVKYVYYDMCVKYHPLGIKSAVSDPLDQENKSGVFEQSMGSAGRVSRVACPIGVAERTSYSASELLVRSALPLA